MPLAGVPQGAQVVVLLVELELDVLVLVGPQNPTYSALSGLQGSP